MDEYLPHCKQWDEVHVLASFLYPWLPIYINPWVKPASILMFDCSTPIDLTLSFPSESTKSRAVFYSLSNLSEIGGMRPE